MVKLTFDQLVAELDKIFGYEHNSYNNALTDFNQQYAQNSCDDDSSDFSSLGEIKLVDGHGGSDEGTDYWKVFHFVDHDIYLKISAYYSSYGDPMVDWIGGDTFVQNAKQVFPKEKTIIFYEESK